MTPARSEASRVRSNASQGSNDVDSLKRFLFKGIETVTKFDQGVPWPQGR
jgi:hypothetical protein